MIFTNKQNLQERLSQSRLSNARYGIIRMNDGDMRHQTLNPKGFFEHVLCGAYMMLHAKNIFQSIGNDESREKAKDDVKALWYYVGSNTRIMGLKSKKGTDLKSIRRVIDSIDDIARIKRTQTVSCSTNINSAIMSRLGYEVKSEGELYTHYQKFL